MPENEMPQQQPTPAPAAQAPARDLSRLYIPAAIIIAGAIIGGALIFALAPHAASQSAGTQPTVAVNIQNVKTAGEPYIGQANAPVVMAFWSDWQCPYCRAFEVGGIPQITTPPALPDLITQYVNTGKLKIVFKDFQFLGPDSTVDGEYARAIWNLYPSLYFEWRTAMYNQQPEENSLDAADNKTHVEQVTKSISGISLSAVEADIGKNQSTYDSEMQADEQEGETNGISGTPGFIIGTQLISGAQPLATFTAAIDAQLK